MSAQSPAIDITEYKIINKIGEGSYSIVYRVKDLKTERSYAAKVSKFMIAEETKNNPETLSLFREVNLMSLINHPSILKFISFYPTNFEGDPLPTIITELALNGSLRDIISMETRGLAPSEWNHTKKLINIYGIASSMSYLHSHNILHRDLKPENILIDQYLNPKISDFGLSKITDFLSKSMNVESQHGMKGTPAYMAPEILLDEKPSKSSDVYAFGFIVFEIMTCENPFENIKIVDLMNKIINDGYRPPIKSDVPNSYRDLIERCWSQDAELRPSFDQIVSELKTNDELITDLVDGSDFYDYVEFIDKYQNTFDVTKKIIHFKDFIEHKDQNKNVKPILFNCDYSKNNDDQDVILTNFSNESEESNKQNSINISEESEESNKQNLASMSNESEESDKKNLINISSEGEESNTRILIDTKDYFNKLSLYNQNLVEEARKDSEKQFEIGRYLIEGKNDFPKNVELGIQYIEHSVNNKCVNATFYYIELLIKGKIIKENLDKANKFLMKLSVSDDTRIFYIQGLINYKKSQFTKAAKFYKKGSQLGNSLCMYKYGKMLFIGEGTKRNTQKAIEYFTKSKEQGFEKSGLFIASFNTLNNKKFSKFPPETQLIFITNNIKSKAKKRESEFSEIFLSPKNMEKLFFNKSLKSSYFYEFLELYNDISIEINYPSESFKAIIDLVIKIRKENLKRMKIGVFITSFSSQSRNGYLSRDVSYYIINSSIRIIPSKAFEDCASMIQITIPSSVTSIGDSAFNRCSSLTRITIPFSVTSIGDSAFSYCFSLSQISIPSSITSIGNSSFYFCSGLTQVAIPSSVTSIGNSAFYCCSKLELIEIPSSVTQIGDSAFSYCFSLKQINIPSSVHSIGNSAFKKCPVLTQITIPSSVTSIGDSAFSKCSGLTQITIPSSITRIGNSAFSNCTSLSQITFLSSSLTQTTVSSFVAQIGDYAFSDCTSLAQIAIPSPVTHIGNYVFKGCSSLTKIAFPSSLTYIGNSAFYNCTSLTNIIIPSSVTHIGGGAFNQCIKLSKIGIQYNKKPNFKCPENKFLLCKSNSKIDVFDTFLSNISNTEIINLPAFIKIIEFSAFKECTSLTEITIPSSVTQIGDYAFFACLSLVQISIPSSVAQIGNYAFSHCSKLKQITIHSSITQIKNNTFAHCSSLSQIEIPSSVTQIDDYAFYACSSLTRITIPSSVTSIGDHAFYSCSLLEKITIPSSVTSIGDYAFFHCSSLTQVTIPSSLNTDKIGLGSNIEIKEI